MQIRASLKFVKLGYLVSVLLAAGIALYLLSMDNRDDRMWALLAIPAMLALYAAIRQVQRRLITLTIAGDSLRYEAGLLSKTTRTMDLAKLQDVRVDQTLVERLLNIGDLSLETAGGTSRVVIESIDRPQEAADHILEMSRARHRNV